MEIVTPGYVEPNASGVSLAPIELPSVEVKAFRPNDPACPLITPTTKTQNYSAAGGSIGDVAVAGGSYPLVATTGTAAIYEDCFEILDPPTTICNKRLDKMNLQLADVATPVGSVSGLSVRSVASAAIVPVSAGVGRIEANSLLLAVSGSVAGTPTKLVVTNPTPWSVQMGALDVKINGTIDLTASGVGGAALPVHAAVNVVAPKSTPQQVACGNASYVQRLFGFEDSYKWTPVNATVSYVASPTTQGCGALAVSGQGFMTVSSSAFQTTTVTLQPALSVDVRVPGNQPNPWWIGDMQAYLSCPSGNVENQFIGQVPLTGLTTNAYSTLRFPLPAAVMTTLNRPLADCSFKLALNVNQVNSPWLLDNLRFTP